MAKFYGEIGYSMGTTEVVAGTWQENVLEKFHSGDILRNSRSWENEGQKVNDNLQLSNEISILADPFAMANFQSMRWVKWMGVKWKVDRITVEFPRLRLTLGGAYNEFK